MRRDVWLNLALASQVVLTVALTGWLWLLPFGRQVLPTERAQVTPVPSGGFVSVPGLVRPARFIVHWADGAHTAVDNGTFEYDGVWDALHTLLAGGTVLRTADWQADLGGALNAVYKTPAIDVEMAGPLPLGDWVQQWGGTLGESSHDRTLINRISLVLGPEPAIYYFGPAGIWRGPGLAPVLQESVLGWLQRTDHRNLVAYRPFKTPDGFDTLPGLFVPATPPLINPPQLKQSPREARGLEASIFPDLSVVREIAEGNGAMMFTDGQKYLRLNPGGAVEYRAPEPSARARAPALGQALNLVAQFVAEHGGWPPGLVLTGAIQSGGQTALTFSRSVGPWALVSSEPLLRVELSSDRVVSFYRLAAYSDIRPPAAGGAGQQAMQPESALTVWRTRGPRRGLRRLESVYFAYAYRNGGLTPVWCYSFVDAPTLMLDARTGETVP